MNIIAYYLPQFHEIEENNRAWGKGFTEWDNVKKAAALFEHHNQPRKPLNDNYYNLLDTNMIKWQVELAKKYGISGFCMYHYWFRDGKHVLEKPAELILANKDIEIPFCFSWANEPWTKTWHGAAGEKEVLIEQRYGDIEQWKEHFDYLLPFFQDDRYIHIDGKPVFLIYQINKIGCFNRMIDYWNQLAIENGMAGLYIIDMLTSDGKVNKNRRVAASVDFEPGKSTRFSKNSENVLKKKSYDEICMRMLATEHKKNEYRCMFVDYDDTPRRGIKGTVIEGSTPEKFGQYLQKTIQSSENEGNEYVFINAWNEWGEGNYLEPDQNNTYRYLEAVKQAINKKYDEIVIPDVVKDEVVNDKKEDKFRKYYDLCNQWIKLIYDGYFIEDYFKRNGYKRIAIYGMGELGNRLIQSLAGTDIEVVYGIDQNVWVAFADVDIKGINEEERFEGIDCIVVTPIHAFDKIEMKLKCKCTCRIISLEEIIDGL